MLYVITGQNFKQNRFLGSSGQKNTGKQPKNDNLKEQKHLKIENLRATDSISLKRAYMHHLTTFHLLKTEVSIDRGVGGGGGCQRGQPKIHQKIPENYQNLDFNITITLIKQFIKCYKAGGFPTIFNNIFTVYSKYIGNAGEYGGLTNDTGVLLPSKPILYYRGINFPRQIPTS